MDDRNTPQCDPCAEDGAGDFHNRLTGCDKDAALGGENEMGSRISVCIEDYDRLAGEVDASLGDIDDLHIARLAEAYEILIKTRATTVWGVAQKLRCMARHFVGGEVPANDVEKVAAELTDLAR